MSVVNVKFAGLGGTGVIKASDVMAELVFEQGYDVKKAEVHGMSQRGGDVQSHLRLSTDPIHSDLIPLGGADLIVSLEPMEALRYLPYLSKDGWIVTSSVPFENIPNYPDLEKVLEALRKLPQVIILDVEATAKEVNSPRGANMVLLGATSAVMGLLDPDKLRDGIRRIFARKGDAVVEANIKAFDAGLLLSQKNR